MTEESKLTTKDKRRYARAMRRGEVGVYGYPLSFVQLVLVW
jgi:hypothetical protein